MQPYAINTDNIFRESELDKGFVIRANDSVSKLLRELISGHNPALRKEQNMEVINLDSNKRTFG